MNPLSQIALTLVPQLSASHIRHLVGQLQGDDPFNLPLAALVDVLRGDSETAQSIASKHTLQQAEQQLLFCEKNHIRTLFFTDSSYPSRLNRADTNDCPALLYVMGTADLNAERSVAVVGTRRATPWGCSTTERLIHELAPHSTPIVSGLAYGIDTAAHRAAIACGLPTIAVLAHGLDRIYPPANRNLAQQLLEHDGALVTEYPMGTTLNARFFPARNRIIAALADATVVVEAAERGGALITAEMAVGYHRPLFAVPGRPDDTYSRGTNNLIASRRAALLRGANDIAAQLDWPSPGQQFSLQIESK